MTTYTGTSHFVDRKVLSDAFLVPKFLILDVFSHHLRLSKCIGKSSDSMVFCYQNDNTTNDILFRVRVCFSLQKISSGHSRSTGNLLS